MRTLNNLTVSSVAVSGSVTLPNSSTAFFRNFKVLCRGLAAVVWTLSAGVDTDQLVELGTGTGTTSRAFTGDTGPWPVMVLSWAANDGVAVVNVDAIFDEKARD